MSSIASSRTGESFTQGNMEYSPGERSPLRRSSFTAEGGGDDCGKCLDAFGSCLGIKPHGEPQRDWTAATGTAAQPGSYTGSHSTNYGTTGPTHTSLRRDGGQSAIASGATHAKGKAPSAASMNSSVGVHAASTSAFSLASSAEGTPGAKSGVGLDDATGPFGNWKFGQLSVGGASRDGEVRASTGKQSKTTRRTSVLGHVRQVVLLNRGRHHPGPGPPSIRTVLQQKQSQDVSGIQRMR